MPAEQLDSTARAASPLRLASQTRPASPDLRVATPERQCESVLARQVAELEAEVAHLQRGLESRTHIAIAIGMLAERFRCTSSQAWSLLQRLSSHTNLKLRRVADLLVAQAQGECEETDHADLALLAAHVPGLLRSDRDDVDRA